MFRLSRIHAPRATLAAVVLLAGVLVAFGVVANAHVEPSLVALLPEGVIPDWRTVLGLCFSSFGA